MRRLIPVIGMLFIAFSLFGQGLTIDMQLNVASQDYANNYLSYRNQPAIGGPGRTNERDQFDAATSASKLGSTYGLNQYYRDPANGTTLPSGLRGLLLYPVADSHYLADDALSVSRAANGVITVRYVHRGTAYEMVTDTQGRFDIMGRNSRFRKIGHTDNAIHADFSSNGRVTGINWNSVWNSSIAADKQVGTTSSRTGAITSDAPASGFHYYAGSLQFRLNGNILTINGTLAPTNR